MSCSTGYDSIVGVNQGEWPGVLPLIEFPKLWVYSMRFFGKAAKEGLIEVMCALQTPVPIGFPKEFPIVGFS